MWMPFKLLHDKRLTHSFEQLQVYICYLNNIKYFNKYQIIYQYFEHAYIVGTNILNTNEHLPSQNINHHKIDPLF